MKKYVTDFANPKVVGAEGTIVTPHLGASTKESEDNCAVMAVKEIRDFLENGNIKNSVNFPNCSMGLCTGAGRVTICHKNIPGMLGAFTTVMGNAGVNISDMTNKGKGDYAYTMMDLESPGTVLFACNVWLRKDFQIRFQTAPPRTSATSMPCAFRSSRILSASAKFLAFFASYRFKTSASISGSPSPVI